MTPVCMCFLVLDFPGRTGVLDVAYITTKVLPSQLHFKSYHLNNRNNSNNNNNNNNKNDDNNLKKRCNGTIEGESAELTATFRMHDVKDVY